MIQKLLNEIEGRHFLLKKKYLPTIDSDYDVLRIEPDEEFKLATKILGHIHVIDNATFDRVCAALVVAVKQRDTWMNEAAQAFDFKQDLALERENETLAKILTGKTKE